MQSGNFYKFKIPILDTSQHEDSYIEETKSFNKQWEQKSEQQSNFDFKIKFVLDEDKPKPKPKKKKVETKVAVPSEPTPPPVAKPSRW